MASYDGMQVNIVARALACRNGDINRSDAGLPRRTRVCVLLDQALEHLTASISLLVGAVLLPSNTYSAGGG